MNGRSFAEVAHFNMEKTQSSDEPFRLMISGSRTITDKEFIFGELDKVYAEHRNLVLISGGAKGADTIAEQWAESHNLVIEQHKPNWKQHGRGAGIIRNKEMVLASDFVVIFWDGKSRGTKSVIDFCKKQEKPHKICENNLTK